MDIERVIRISAQNPFPTGIPRRHWPVNVDVGVDKISPDKISRLWIKLNILDLGEEVSTGVLTAGRAAGLIPPNSPVVPDSDLEPPKIPPDVSRTFLGRNLQFQVPEPRDLFFPVNLTERCQVNVDRHRGSMLPDMVLCRPSGLRFRLHAIVINTLGNIG